MGTWMATIRFPDGTERYARYSTVVAAVVSNLYTTFHVEHHRAEPTGEPLPTFPARPRAPIDELIPVVISHAPDDNHWYAVYCPRRCMVLGPTSPHRCWRIQATSDLAHGTVHRLRHLSRLRGRGLCGAPVLDAPLPYRRYESWWGEEEPEPQPARTDIFAEWTSPDMCRECLLLVLDQAE
ncbi:hypothetical protein [Actinoplanes sp. NPDC020271]|uniref:hypothetical protein n=1 Tax=Actinoplanes sp. NPDC020271 TaxID=3363896 RepID=UPI00379531BD